MDTYSENQSSLREITKALKDYLKKTFPNIDWSFELNGPVTPVKPSGTVTADEVSFESPTKGGEYASIEYSIYLIVPDSKTVKVDELSMRVRESLLDNFDLSGTVQNSTVKKIVFGTAPGVRGNAGAAILKYEVNEWL